MSADVFQNEHLVLSGQFCTPFFSFQQLLSGPFLVIHVLHELVGSDDTRPCLGEHALPVDVRKAWR